MYCQEYLASIACSVETGGLWSVANGSFFLTLLPCSFSHFYPTWVFPQGWRAAVFQELLLRGLSTGCSLFVEQPPALSHSSTGHSVGLLSGISAPAPATPPPPPSSLSWMLTGLFLTPFFLTSHCQAPFCLFLSLSSQKHHRHGWWAPGHPVAWPLWADRASLSSLRPLPPCHQLPARMALISSFLILKGNTFQS